MQPTPQITARQVDLPTELSGGIIHSVVDFLTFKQVQAKKTSYDQILLTKCIRYIGLFRLSASNYKT